MGILWVSQTLYLHYSETKFEDYIISNPTSGQNSKYLSHAPLGTYLVLPAARCSHAKKHSKKFMKKLIKI
jgi:hypothetical protein